MRIRITIAFCSLAAWLALVAPSLAVSLVTNGDFETGDYSGWTVQGTPSNLFNVATFKPHTGTYSMFIADYEIDNDQIYQTVPSVNGQQYALEFWLFNYAVGNDGLQVFWEGSLVLSQKPVEAPLEEWTKYTLPLTATANGSELRLGGFDVPLAIYFDDISITPVPEPSAIILAAGGIALLAVRRLIASRKPAI